MTDGMRHLPCGLDVKSNIGDSLSAMNSVSCCKAATEDDLGLGLWMKSEYRFI